MFNNVIVASATAQEESVSLFSALGIDWALLVQQALAFLILLAILAKFVFPVLIKTIEKRRDQIEAGIKEAKEAEEKLAQTEEKIGTMLRDARTEADDIIARSHQEATRQVAEAEEKAKVRAEQIVTDAHAQLESDVRKAREALKKDTIELVALATERVVGQKIDAQKDSKLIAKALEEKA